MKSQAAIERSLEAARRELDEIEIKLKAVEHFRERKQILMSFVSAGEALLIPAKKKPVATTNAPASGPTPQMALPAATNTRVVDGAWRVLLERKMPMLVSAIAQELKRHGWKLSEKWATEVVRAAVSRDERFEKIGPGVFALTEWPEHMKKVS